MKLYIYTIPKSGTYLLAAFMENMGFDNTGYHVSQDDYLDTKRFTFEENARTPSITSVEQYFITRLRSLHDNQMAFGHVPVPILSWALPDYRFICVYRHPRKTLLSEFIDFRFRRIDVDFVSREVIQDDREAFLRYLNEHGPIHMTVFSDMLAAATLFNNPLFRQYPSDRVIFINFDGFLHNSGPAHAIAQHYGLDTRRVDDAWQDALATETKTNATTLNLDRDAFWTAEAVAAADRLDLEAYVTSARSAGLNV
ncbi:sulfotransferase domain-containing protein [Frigidibacter sp.]|uniref:sulfotransferase domain-containing protein n=1 Tax=Frigidibacter sp. TaxID=2586418 RepID=UPI0027361E78|nr:sulfotransferase domain-containing protein [Frigidibacter sp.]